MKEFIIVVALLVMLVGGRPQFGGPTESSTVFGNRRPPTTLPTSKPSSSGSSGGVSSGPGSSGELLDYLY